jgi:hypothetical protein
MIRIHISTAAFAAIAASLGADANARLNAHGSPLSGFSIWLDKTTLSQLDRLRRPDESYSEVILRLAEMEDA